MAVPSLASVDQLPADKEQDFRSSHLADLYCWRIIGYRTGDSRPPNAKLRRQLSQFKLDNLVLYRLIYHPGGL